MASPFFFVKKKDGSLRPIQDYRKLNELTIKIAIPSHSFPTSSTHYKMLATLPNSMSVGDITTFVSKGEMSTRLPFVRIVAYLNRWSCSLVLPIHPLPSRR